ncbi:MAG: 6-hydroxynicotinate reductase [Rhizobiaceae bacterium]
MADAPAKPEKIRCDACPVMCYIADGRSGACDRYANEGGQLVRLDALTILERSAEKGGEMVPFLDQDSDWDGKIIAQPSSFVTAVGAGTTYPDYKPAPFIVQSEVDDVDMITVVTEGIFSYCGAKIKIDTDRHLGPERNLVRVEGEPVGHVTTGEYGSQMLSLGGVNHLTGGGKKEGRVTCATLLALCNGEAVELAIDEGSTVVVEAGNAPIVNGVKEERMRVGCGSATVGMFASQWKGLVDEVVVVDDHITGVMSEHQAGKVIGWQPTGIKIKGRRSTPGRYFQVAEPGTGWGGTNLDDPLVILGDFNDKFATPGQSLLMVSTTGEQFAYYELDKNLNPVKLDMPERLMPSVGRIEENCEPALCSVIFMGGAGGSLRAGVTENPVKLTRSVKDALTFVTCGGAPTYTWPGGGITVMADVTRMPENSFGYVPTPALVAPIEFTMRRDDYEALGGHMDHVMPLADAIAGMKAKQNDHILKGKRQVGQDEDNPWPTEPGHYRWGKREGAA